MNILTTKGGLLDLISEEVGCKSGLLLSDHELRSVGEREGIEDLIELTREEDSLLRIRPEEIEDVVVHVRKALGNLPDDSSGMGLMVQRIKDLHHQGANLSPICDAISQVVQSGKYKVIGEEAMEEIIALSGANPLHVLEVLGAIVDMQSRSVVSLFPRMRAALWDGVIPLSNLFEGELVPKDPEVYLDQRFIDYLAANGEDLERMHWRNFERLCGEFFRRQGYEVELGPGTKDGGTDVRVWTDRESKAGPPLLMIQCKRYKSTNLVGVETVKAFWADVHFEKAEGGLLATTSRATKEGRKLSEARQWPLTFAENQEVRQWARSMWRHAPKLR